MIRNPGRILAQVVRGRATSPTDTPEEAAFRRALVASVAEIHAGGGSIELKVDPIEWEDDGRDQQEEER